MTWAGECHCAPTPGTTCGGCHKPVLTRQPAHPGEGVMHWRDGHWHLGCIYTRLRLDSAGGDLA